MGEKSFLKTLREYFELKADNEILIGDKRNIVIPMEWVFTEKIDREVIQRALVQVLKQHRPDYVENYVNSKMKGSKQRTAIQSEGQQAKEDELRKQANARVKNISLNIGRDGLKVVINGIDDWTKAIVSENPQNDSKILQVSEEEFCEKILGVLKSDSIRGILDSLEMSEGQKEYFQTIFANTPNQPTDEFTLSGIKASMVQAAQNLTEYYDYLIKEKDESSKHSIVINQRQGSASRRERPPVPTETSTRRSPVYSFVEREKILRELGPTHVINVHGCDELGEVIPNIYTTFIYDNPRGNKGKLIVAEPLEGTHSTRMVFMTDEQFEQFETTEYADKYEDIARKYLEMSTEEFVREKNAKRVNHTEIEVYKGKIQYIISGKPLTATEGNMKGYYNTILNELYGKKKISIADVANISENVLGEELRAADRVLDEINAIDKETQEKGENND